MLPNAVRYGGTDRYATALLIAQNMAPDTATLFFAYGGNFPDALAGSVLASYTNSPIILVDKHLPEGFNTFLEKVPQTVKNVYVLGGSSVISDSLVNDEIQTFAPFTQRYTE